MGKLNRKMTRAEKAGIDQGKAIVEMVHLMYQNNTSSNFYKGLMAVLEEEVRRRKNKI